MFKENAEISEYERPSPAHQAVSMGLLPGLCDTASFRKPNKDCHGHQSQAGLPSQHRAQWSDEQPSCVATCISTLLKPVVL